MLAHIMRAFGISARHLVAWSWAGNREHAEKVIFVVDICLCHAQRRKTHDGSQPGAAAIYRQNNDACARANSILLPTCQQSSPNAAAIRSILPTVAAMPAKQPSTICLNKVFDPSAGNSSASQITSGRMESSAGQRHAYRYHIASAMSRSEDKETLPFKFASMCDKSKQRSPRLDSSRTSSVKPAARARLRHNRQR